MPYDAVVIGAGVNGLAAAVHLAAKGWKVAVVERADVAGGAVKTREITRPGLSPRPLRDEFGPVRGLAVFRRAQRSAVRARAGFRDGGALFRERVSRRQLARRRKRSRGECAADRGADSADAERWRAMAAAFAQDAPHIFALLGAPMPSLAGRAHDLCNAWRARGTGVGRRHRAPARCLRRANGSTRISRTTSSRPCWRSGACTSISRRTSPAARCFPIWKRWPSRVFGMALGQGGADDHHHRHDRARSKRLAARCSSMRRCKASRSRAARPKPCVLASGERIEATRAVIANLHPRVLFDQLVRDRAAGGAAAREAAARAGDHDDSSWRSRDLPAWSAGADLRKFAYVHLAPSLARDGEDLYRGARRIVAGRARAGGRPADRDRSLARAGRTARAVGAGPRIAVAHPRRRGGHDQRHDWDAREGGLCGSRHRHDRALCARLLRATFSAAPCSRRPISSAITPISSAATASAAAIISTRTFCSARRSAGRATARRSSGLYMVGASTWPGAGAGAGSGFMLAKMLAGA